MPAQTKIPWTDSTFNPWLGCTHAIPTSRNSTKFTMLFAAPGCTIKHPNACGSTIRVWFGFLGMLLITALTTAGNVVFRFP
jgi:protein gp37